MREVSQCWGLRLPLLREGEGPRAAFDQKLPLYLELVTSLHKPPLYLGFCENSVPLILKEILCYSSPLLNVPAKRPTSHKYGQNRKTKLNSWKRATSWLVLLPLRLKPAQFLKYTINLPYNHKDMVKSTVLSHILFHSTLTSKLGRKMQPACILILVL